MRHASTTRLNSTCQPPGHHSPADLKPAAWLTGALSWLLPRRCPLCRGAQALPPTRRQGRWRSPLCEGCRMRLAVYEGGMNGAAPLPWWSSGSYGGELRRTLLDLRRRPDRAVIQGLLEPLHGPLSRLLSKRMRRPGPTPLLVPVPSWKRQPNPLPGLVADGLARGLGLRRLDLLARSHPVLGQHRLGRRLRLENQKGSFELRGCHGWRQPRPVLIVDDILTTGSTVRHAALCLQEAGWPVLGAVCLARTPDRRHWLRTP